VKDGCVEVEYRDGLLGYFVSEVVAGADYLTALNSRSAIHMLIAPGL